MTQGELFPTPVRSPVLPAVLAAIDAAGLPPYLEAAAALAIRAAEDLDATPAGAPQAAARSRAMLAAMNACGLTHKGVPGRPASGLPSEGGQDDDDDDDGPGDELGAIRKARRAAAGPHVGAGS